MRRISLFIGVYFVIFSKLFAQDTKSVKDWLSRLSIDQNNIVLTRYENQDDAFKIWAKDGVLHVEGGSISALCYGIGQSLKSLGVFHMSWEGNRQVKDFVWTNQEIKTGQSPFKYRSYLNACTFGYSTPWWDWNRWEKEIDWMVLRGINMPTAMMGQEYIWKQVWNELGISDQKLQDYFPGPAFLPWHRMGNLNAHSGPLPYSFMEREMNLQKKVLGRMRELDLKPVVPAFSGYVPVALREIYPKAKVHQMKPWSGFKSHTYFLDPKDPLFKIISGLFIKKYTEIYGKCDYFLADAFNEMEPPVSKENKNKELREYGKILYESIAESSPEATWVMQGWMFGADKEFWTPESTQSFLKDVPNDKIIIQDIGNDRFDVWKSLNAFNGKQWIFGFIHNYGGTNPIFGNFNYYKNTVDKLLTDPLHANLKGFGVMPEGINNNSVIYEYLFDLPWRNGKDNFEEWATQYLKNRYGVHKKTIVDDWILLSKNVYAVKYWEPRWWGGAGSYLHNKRPTLEVAKTSVFPGDQKVLLQVVKNYLQQVKENPDNNLMAYDLSEFARHYFAIKTDDILRKVCQKYEAKHVKEAEKLQLHMRSLMIQLDKLSGYHPNQRLYTWCKEATEISEPKDLYLKNAKQLVTTWGGGRLKDYSSREWQGLVKEFYWPRWEMFFNGLRTGKDIAEISKEIVKWENNWVDDKMMPAPVDMLSNQQLIKLIDQMLVQY